MINEEEMYMFHGTKDGNIDSILEENFRLDKAVGQAYGAGIYFSEFPCVSCSYGTLILCRVLPGRIETHYHGIGHQISYGFNSRKVAAGDRFDSSAIHVIKDVCQILPQYVITLKDISSTATATASTSYVPRYAFTAPALPPPTLPPPTLSGVPASRYNPFVQNLGSTSTSGMAFGNSVPSTSTAQPTQNSLSTFSANATSQSPQTKAAQRAKAAQERKNAKALAKATEKQQKALEEARAKSAAKALADKQKADRLKLIEQEKADKLARLEQERTAKKALAEKEKADKQARLEQERAAKKALAEKERADRQAAKKALAAKAKADAAAEKARKQVEAAAEVKASKEALVSKAVFRAVRDRRSSDVLQSPTASRENKSSHLDDSVIDLSSP